MTPEQWAEIQARAEDITGRAVAYRDSGEASLTRADIGAAFVDRRHLIAHVRELETRPFTSNIWPGIAVELGAQVDTLTAQLAEVRQHLGTLTPGGSHTCITCAAHCVAIGDLESQLQAMRRALVDLLADLDAKKDIGDSVAKAMEVLSHVQ